jgi:aspartate ammonia-lyase
MAAGLKPTNGVHSAASRTEKDSLGQLELSEKALYGINTARAVTNFPYSGRTIATWPEFVRGFGLVKQAAALANVDRLLVRRARSGNLSCL